MSYASFLHPRPEVLSDAGVEGIIDLTNLEDRKRRKIEARPGVFLDLTYPTAEIKRVVAALDARFTKKTDTPALFLFEGLKGSGKSHLLVLAYHLLQSAAESAAWLKQHGLALHVPAKSSVVVHKYTDRPLLRLWDHVFGQAGIKISGSYEVYPSDKQILEGIGDRHLVIILDELERGIEMISDGALRHQNIGFLQMLSELGSRTPQVTVLASIYDAGKEPGATLIRVPNVRVQFARSTLGDRARVVLHRLFSNYLGFDPNTAAATVDSFINTYRRFLSQFDAGAFRTRMMECYPFHPELLTLILERVPARGGFQNIRGSLTFLANLVRLTHAAQDIITAGHATLRDLANATLLQDLDPSGDLISRAKTNMEELAKFPLSERVASATMLYTLAGDGRNRGATRDELIRHAMLPGDDINDFEQTLMAFAKYASYFHTAEGRHFFDLEENADAKVEYRSLTIDQDGSKAGALLRAIWTEGVFRDTEATTVFTTPDDTKQALDAMHKDRPRFVLAPRRLKPEERHDLYFGLTARNQVLLLEPRAQDFNLDGNADLAKWAKRHLAARELTQQAEQAGDRDRRDEYERIGREDQKNVTDAIRRAGLQFIRFDAYGASAAADRVEPENLAAASKEEAIKRLSEDLFPVMVFQEHIAARLDQVKGKLVKEVDKEYRETLTFPVPVVAQSVTRAIRQLCVAAQIGIYHPGGNFCRRDPNLSESELADARIGDPVGETPPPPRPPIESPPPPPTGLARLEVVPGGPLALFVGDARQLTATGFDDQGRPLGSVQVAWRSSNPAVLAVSDVGTVTVLASGDARVTAVAGQVVSNEVVVTVSAGPTEQIAIPFKPSKGQLRQEIAAKLAPMENATITAIRFTVYQGEGDQEGDLSTLPAGLRGSLSGQGTVSFEINIAKRGDMTKAQVEQLCEQLPDHRGAQYSARLEVVRRSAEG